MAPDVRRGGVRISWQAEGPGSAPAILLSNPLGTTREVWAPQIAALSQHFRVVRYDTRGHGQSDAPPRDYTLEELGQDALAVMDAAGVDRAHVCGLSLGGVTAMWLGLEAPLRVRSLVLANTGAKIGTREMWDLRIEQARTVGMGAIADVLMPRWFSDAFRLRAPDTVAGARSMVAACDPAGYAGCCAALRAADLRHEIARIDAPSLVIVGTADPSTPAADGQTIRDSIANARLVALEAAHLSNVECAAAFTNHALAFLREQTDG